jgi:hypothetical protein
MPVDTMVMLELLEEAGEEAVTLDELGVAGVEDPARALLELELAGLEIQRVLVGDEPAGRAVECIRLAAAQVDEQPTVELAAVTPRPAPAPAAPEDRSRVGGVVALAVLLALVALLLRRA